MAVSISQSVLGRKALFISHKKTNATKKHQYERDLIQLSFIVHKLRNHHKTHQKNKFCKSHDRKLLCVITCNTASSKDIKDIKEFHYSPLNSVCTMRDFINYGTDYICA